MTNRTVVAMAVVATTTCTTLSKEDIPHTFIIIIIIHMEAA